MDNVHQVARRQHEERLTAKVEGVLNVATLIAPTATRDKAEFWERLATIIERRASDANEGLELWLEKIRADAQEYEHDNGEENA